MTDRTKRLFPNPFYVLLLVTSVLFVLTIFGYLVSTPVLDQAVAVRGKPGRGSVALAAWFDRNAPLALAVEVALMIVCGLLAMATDRWFPEKPARKAKPTV